MIELPSDFRELLVEFAASEVEYLLIGGYAVMSYGYARATEDFDLWLRPTPDNARRTWSALQRFGAPTADWSLEDFHTPDRVMFMGREPLRIDLLTSIPGVDFDHAWSNRRLIDLDGLSIPVIGRADLIANKRASGRDQDLIDARWLADPSNPKKRR